MMFYSYVGVQGTMEQSFQEGLGPGKVQEMEGSLETGSSSES